MNYGQRVWYCTGGCAQDLIKEKEIQKEKRLYEETLQIAEKTEVKAKREKERYIHLYIKFKRIARVD